MSNNPMKTDNDDQWLRWCDDKNTDNDNDDKDQDVQHEDDWTMMQMEPRTSQSIGCPKDIPSQPDGLGGQEVISTCEHEEAKTNATNLRFWGPNTLQA